jgi:GTP-binding protein
MAAQFIISASRPEQFPREAEPEIAFLGRSNVGKSTLLNALVEIAGDAGGRLAATSSRPGRTQLINFYQVDADYRFVDLPGYGFAKVPPEISRQWKRLIEAYLLDRRALRLAILLLDARRGWMETDVELRRWLEAHRRPFVVAVTKVDKLKSQKEKHRSQASLRDGFAGELLECSGLTGRGVREIWQAISKTQKS